jgi:VanZ family protein
MRFFRLLKPWLPALLWMAVIFSASADRASFQRSSRIVAPLVRWLFPKASEETVHTAVVAVRKAAHMAEYAVLAWLFLAAIANSRGLALCQWSRREGVLAWLLVVVYASTDEIHQLFVPHRQAAAMDVLIDAAGAALGLIFLWVLRRCRRSGQPLS